MTVRGEAGFTGAGFRGVMARHVSTGKLPMESENCLLKSYILKLKIF